MAGGSTLGRNARNASAPKRAPKGGRRRRVIKVSNKRARELGRADGRAGRPPDTAVKSPDEFAYDRGYDEGKAERASSSGKSSSASRKSSTKSGRKSSTRSGRKSSGTRRRARRRRAPGAQLVRSAERRALAPIRARTIDGLVLVAAAGGVAFLYNLLRHADTTSLAIDKVVRAITWVDSTRPIPYSDN